MIYGEESRVRFYNYETYESGTSERKYVSVDILMRTDDDAGRVIEKTGHYDPLTGLLTFDVQAYEKWIRGLEADIATTVLTLAEVSAKLKEHDEEKEDGA